jgi:CRP-like cAMP-binding protein
LLLLLAQTELFKSVPRQDLQWLARHTQTRAFRAGSVLMRQGEASETMHVIVSGRVRVERAPLQANALLHLADLGPGEVVGEMGVITGEPRSATVAALEDTVTVEIGADAVGELINRFPELRGTLLRLLAKRLRSTDALIEQVVRHPVVPAQPPPEL